MSTEPSVEFDYEQVDVETEERKAVDLFREIILWCNRPAVGGASERPGHELIYQRFAVVSFVFQPCGMSYADLAIDTGRSEDALRTMAKEFRKWVKHNVCQDSPACSVPRSGLAETNDCDADSVSIAELDQNAL